MWATGDIEEVLYQGPRTRVVRVGRPGNVGSVIRKECLGEGNRERARHERNLLSRLAGLPGIPELVNEDPAASSSIMMVDVNGVTLASVIGPTGFDTAGLLRLSRDLADLVVRIHDRGVVHKDLNPNNILLIRGSREVLLIDFDLASTFAQERPAFAGQQEIGGTLPYLAPEQTGRTGRPVDHRADLYSLGATLYHLVIGAPPFGDDGDALRLVHDHLARVPVAPQVRNPAVPPMLSRIILRLLEKEPDRRYQSASGLLHDLDLALRGWHDGVEEPFGLGERDFPLRLSPPTQLVGRDEEIAALRESFDQAVAGRLRGVLLAGAPGVGKTSLMNELRQVVSACDGWFVSGKFDQYHRGQSSDAVAQGMGALGLLLLTEPESELAELKERIKAAVGSNAGILVEVVPEFRHLLAVPTSTDPDGPAGAEDTSIDPIEAERRLLQAGLDVLRAVTSPTRPLVFVVDDLQWGSRTPLGFIDLLLTTEDLPGVLVVAAYRDNEMDATHPLSGTLAQWLASGVPPRHLTVANLPSHDLEVLLTAMLRLPSTPPPSLTSMVQAATDGNPFDIVELINALRRDGALSLGPDGWAWDETAVRWHLDSGDVTDLVNARIGVLPPDTVSMLEMMALLGGEVPVEVLEVAAGLSGTEMSERLRPALEDGLLMMESETTTRVRFAHDRVHQAAFARVPSPRRRTLRLDLARAFAPLPTYRTRAAEQYQSVAEAITDPAERHRAAALLHGAAERQALASSGSALAFLDAALSLLTAQGAEPGAGPSIDSQVGPGIASGPVTGVAQGTEHRPGVRFLGQIQSGRHTALYRLGRLEEADEAFEAVRGCHPDVLEFVPTVRDQINSLCNRGLYTASVELGMELLVQLGIDRPGANLEALVNAELDEVLRWLSTADPVTETARPVCTDPHVQATAQLCQAMLAPGFFVNPAVSFWVTLLSLRLWSTRGPCPANYGAIGFAPFVVMAWRQDYRAAMALLDLIMKVGWTHGFDEHLFPARFHALFVEHWFHPLASDLDKARDIRAGLLRAGDIQNVSFTNHVATAAAWECCLTLDEALAEIRSALDFARRIGDEHSAAMFETYLPLIRSLQHADEPPDVPTAGQTLPTSPMAAGYFHVNQALKAVLSADLESAEPHAAAALPLLPAFDGHHHIVWAHAVHALAMTQRVRQSDPSEHSSLLAEVDQQLQWLDRRAEDNPDGFAHLVAWIRAERAAALGDLQHAWLGFDQALGALRKHGRVWHHALIAERAGHFFLSHGLQHFGGLMLADAWRRYQAWGATAKAEDLSRSFPTLSPYLTSAPSSALAATTRTGTEPLASIDLLAVLRASQALSQETNLNRLRDRVVDVLGALTGATDVQLLLWNPEFQTWMLSSSTELPQPINLDSASQRIALPLSALRYVDRTQAPLQVDDVLADPRFRKDPYFSGLDQCSLLVVPIRKQGQPLAMLLLENRLSGGALSADRLDTVMLISGQLAGGIDNALAERFRSVVQHASDLTLVCNSHQVLTYASSASAVLLGSSNLTMLGRSVIDLFHEDDRAELVARLQDPSGDGHPLECRIITADSAVRWVEVAFTDLVADPAVNGVVLRLRDVTEQRELEQQLRHSQKMRSVGVLASGLAHEINTPIQYVITNLRFLSDTYADLIRQGQGQDCAPGVSAHAGESTTGATAVRPDSDDLLEEIPQAIEEALDGVSRVATIVQAMKSFGDSGDEQMRPSDLNEAIRNTVIVATNQIGQVTEVELVLGELPLVRCIIGDIRQVLLNLVLNAAYAIRQDEARDGAPGRITIRSRTEGEDAVVEVEDDGTGISPDIADRVFDQFFTTKDVGLGTGQGLSLAYAVVHDRYHGTLTFTTAVGVGTTFTLRLPIRSS